ncbi:Response regulator receiver domain-containing protein [Acetitomaculum ruminis DSM 5522]|uniref:Stage 0 sporulation protein A homolog n=1 Tax=Acetitomaculum ruminis DSM 5522 TaxID=1120918 RepID=A0A1I0ZZ89_9FIRM|nr:response regulator [Acetitomaculum ruminis]SFB30877.1 Response regulator receiver domain-containing protein [Acetitomaculum ruminis DSM 5522]
MSKEKMMVISQKESFIVRVLINKVSATGAECNFVTWTVNEISSGLEGVSLIVLYMDDGDRPGEDILHFLTDTLEEKSLEMIIVGEHPDIQYVCDHVPGEMIYMTFTRPVDNNKFVGAVTEYFAKADSGAFKKSILIVDDDPQYLTIIREWLKGTYKVSMANSGLQAIKWLGKNKVDLILLDHEMPVTSGPQVLEMLRSDSETRSIPVMFLTGKGDKDSVMEVVSLRPEGYFLKNIQKEELLEKLQEFFILHK